MNPTLVSPPPELTAQEAHVLQMFRKMPRDHRAFVEGFVSKFLTSSLEKHAADRRPQLRIVAGGAA